MKILWYLSLSLLLPAASFGQAILEHSLITAASAAAGAGAKNAGKSIGGVFQNLNHTLDEAGTTPIVNGPRPAPRAESAGVLPKEAATAQVPLTQIVNPSKILIGMERDQLIARFGPPLLAMIDTTSSQIVETMWYPTGRSTQVQIKLIAGKVASMFPPPAKNPKPDR